MNAPLAARLRPKRIDDVKGQGHVLGPDKSLTQALQSGWLPSMIFWGPPGTGKTSLAHLLAQHVNANFMALSAVMSGIKDVRALVERAKDYRQQHPNAQNCVFIDEIHRFNKSQQDAFLPFVEEGLITLIGATTENPAFEINRALLSRLKVIQFKPLEMTALSEIFHQALDFWQEEKGNPIKVPTSIEKAFCQYAKGDGRRLINTLEIALQIVHKDNRDEMTPAIFQQACGHSISNFSKKGDAFYEQISALHKSVRGSNPDAALYWLARMLQGGCDPQYIARRLIRMASEDIGNADPRALSMTLEAWEVQRRLGQPEGELALAQAVCFLACAAKSNAIYLAFSKAIKSAQRYDHLGVPAHLKNIADIGQASDLRLKYRYDHDEPEGVAYGQRYFPEGMDEEEFYAPQNRGLEIKIKEKLERLRELNKRHRK